MLRGPLFFFQLLITLYLESITTKCFLGSSSLKVCWHNINKTILSIHLPVLMLNIWFDLRAMVQIGIKIPVCINVMFTSSAQWACRGREMKTFSMSSAHSVSTVSRPVELSGNAVKRNMGAVKTPWLCLDNVTPFKLS